MWLFGFEILAELFGFEILADLQEIALPEYFYEEYWTIQKRLSCALAAILGGSLGVLLAKKCRPFLVLGMTLGDKNSYHPKTTPKGVLCGAILCHVLPSRDSRHSAKKPSFWCIHRRVDLKYSLGSELW